MRIAFDAAEGRLSFDSVYPAIDRISHVIGEAGVAATAIRNVLHDQRPN